MTHLTLNFCMVQHIFLKIYLIETVVVQKHVCS